MEAIGEHLGETDDAGSWLPRPVHLYALPGEETPQQPGPGPAGHFGPDVLGGLAAQLAAAALAAPGILAGATYAEAAAFADRVEGLSRNVGYLQILAAGSVDQTRTGAIKDAATTTGRSTTASRSAREIQQARGWVTGWDENGVETLSETDADWPARSESPTRPAAPSPADDGCRTTAEFLRLRLRIPIREARRRLALAQHTLPGASLTGQQLPPARPRIAAALAPSCSSEAGTTEPGTVQGPAVSSYSGTLITATLDRLQHRTTEGMLDRIEQHLTEAASATDPDFLARLARRWTDIIDADGTEPSEEALRHTQGAFIRKPRHGLHHVEIFATTDQYEHLLTVMNTATNPRTTTPNTSGNGNPAAGAAAGAAGDVEAAGAAGAVGAAGEAGEAEEAGTLGWAEGAGSPNLDRRTRAQKQLDGLVTAAKTALATNTLPTTGGNRPQIIATIHYRDLFPTSPIEPGTQTGTGTGTATTPGRGASKKLRTSTDLGTGTKPGTGTPTGTGTGNFAFTGPVAAAILRKIACDADIIPALLGTRGEILDLGRKTRLFTPAQRTALTARDQGCAFPDCTIPAPWCEAHHITYWSRNGPTTTSNGVLLCSHHHHLVHKETWTITSTHGTPAFIPPPHIDPTRTPRQNHYFKPPPHLSP